ncbi:MAG: hypothetical protein EA381_05240 [Planctomycetaceae bacterium]|nr:MAG: hypothetical protein EA381_05240 [Planctomycetaceae bacterium]
MEQFGGAVLPSDGLGQVARIAAMITAGTGVRNRAMVRLRRKPENTILLPEPTGTRRVSLGDRLSLPPACSELAGSRDVFRFLLVPTHRSP